MTLLPPTYPPHTTARVELYPSCCGGRIDRTLPVVLQGHLSPHEFDAFCHQVDAQLVQINYWVAMGFFIAVILAVAVSSMAQDWGLGLVVLGIVGVIWFTVCLQSFTRHQLQNVCHQWTERYPRQLSFHVRFQMRGDLHHEYEKPYIEIYILNSSSAYEAPTRRRRRRRRYQPTTTTPTTIPHEEKWKSV